MTYLPFLISGLGIGAVYALSGVGLVVLFRATGVLNFAFGAVGALGAHVAWQMLEWRLPLAIAILAAVVVSALVSFLYGRLLLLSHRDTVVRAVGTLALALVLIAVMGVIWGEFPRRLQFPTDQMFLTVFGVRLTYTRILALLLAGLMVGAITAFLSRTRLGLDMRALANDRDLGDLHGVRIRHTETAAWVITGVSRTGRTAAGDLVRLQGTFLTFLVIPAIAAAILGQLRSLDHRYRRAGHRYRRGGSDPDCRNITLPRGGTLCHRADRRRNFGEHGAGRVEGPMTMVNPMTASFPATAAARTVRGQILAIPMTVAIFSGAIALFAEFLLAVCRHLSDSALSFRCRSCHSLWPVGSRIALPICAGGHRGLGDAQGRPRLCLSSAV